MFDTMTMTKIIGGFCGALLIFLLANWASETIYHVGGEEKGEGEAYASGYVIEVASADGASDVVEEGPDFATLFAAADAAKGERVWNKCSACHKLEDGVNGTGPYLFGVVDRDIGGVAGYGYSTALAELPGDWTPEALDAFLEDPKGYAAGTKMSFRGLPKGEDRANLIAYLATFGG